MKFIEFKDVAKYKAVLLDLDNTLYSYDPCHQYALDKVYELMNKREEYEDFSSFKTDYNISRTRINIDLAGTGASHSRLLYFKILIERIKGKTDTAYIELLEKLYWESFFEKMILFEGVMEFLAKCKEDNKKVCIVTDLTTQIQFKKVIRLGIEKYIDYIVTSEEVGVEKPHPYIFLCALEKVNVFAKDVIMIGDDLKKDIHGAMNMNIDYLHFDGK